ncbi:MAG: DUF2779 domain-containing protein, partial [Candidatus Omnitrophica bacterium]|nr:DUF2779 domain-containing protein [Candidatus Omnitrophota bacterium]
MIETRLHLNKNQFLVGLNCHRKLWLCKRRPELIDVSKLPSPYLSDEGKKVGELARTMFTGGVLVEERDFEIAVRRTQELMDSGTHVLFEAAFEFDGIRIRTDILERNQDGWILHEVKSGTMVKNEYVEDVALQVYVLQSLGFEVEPRLLYLDKQATLESHSLFIESGEDFRRAVENLVPTIEDFHPIAYSIASSPDEPPPTLTRNCKHCEFRETRCFADFQDRTVLDFYRGGDAIDSLLSRDIFLLRDIPPISASNPVQRRQIDCEATAQPYVSPELQDEIASIQHPLYFLDFEVATPAIPRYPGQNPYSRIPFQWSLHIEESPGSKLVHREWLHTDQSDPRREFCESLLEAVEGDGTIVVYSHFEQSVLNAMAGEFPDLATAIYDVVDRLWDLCAAIRDHFYHPGFAGSYSIKKVLPTLVPDMSYEGMAISDGMAAIEGWCQMIELEEGDDLERERLKKALLEYCRLDTLAMVRVYEAL